MDNFCEEKVSRILEAFAYIADKAIVNKKNMYNILKVFYLADKLHMERYGRFIFDEDYVAMAKGPVPSLAYDLMKDIKINKPIAQGLESPIELVSEYQVVKLREANLDFFSKTDLMCIDEVIELSKTHDLGDLSHDEAWKNTERNKIMNIVPILSTMQNKEAIIELHNNRYP